MTRSSSIAGKLKKAMLAAAAGAVLATGLAAPAAAGGKDRYYHYDGGWHDGHHYWRDYDRDYRRRGRGHISGGEAALIAAGIIGGVILIDGALDRRNRDDDWRYDDRRYDNRRYDGRRYDDRHYDDRLGAFDEDYYYRRDDRFSDAPDYDLYPGRESGIVIDDGSGLLGGLEKPSGAARIAVDVAFRECVAETRGAAGAGGMTVAAPGAPDEVDELPDGAVRLVARFRASNARGDQWTRRMVCEADEQGIRFLQVD
jgi:hypothetical protein